MVSNDKCLKIFLKLLNLKKLNPSSERFMKYTPFNEEGKVGGLNDSFASSFQYY